MNRIRVLVCGATGFIGRNMAEALAADDRFEVIGTHFTRPPYANPAIRFVRADLTDKAQVDTLLPGIDIVIQAAAATSGINDVVNRPYIHIADNAVMNANLMRGCFDHHVRHFVFFSCSIMYPSSDTPVGEDDFDAGRPLEPRYFGAGWTKIYNEKMCEFYAGQGRTRYTVIRHSNIYGPWDKYDLARSHVFGATVTKVLTNTDGRLIIWGSGEEARDLLHVDDLVEFVQLALAKQDAAFRLYNAGLGEMVSVRHLAEMIIAASGRRLSIEHDLTKPTIKTSLCLDCSKAARELGWRPQIALADGIARTLDWYRQNRIGEALSAQ